MKKIIFILTVFGLCLSGQPVKAFDVTIDKMKIIMNVSENGLVSVDTTLEVNFGLESHGIYVYIPQDYKMVWTVGSKKLTRSYHWPIINLKVYDSMPYERSIVDGALYLKLGDPNILITGYKNYHYSYDFRLRDLGLDGIELFYMNLVGTGWELPITEVEYKIILPKGWPQDIFLYQGPQGSTQTIETYSIDQNVLYGTASNLMPKEGLTIYTQLSDDGSYFNFVKPKDYSLSIVLGSLVLMVAMFLLFQKVGKDRPLMITPQFGPIPGLSSSQIGYIMDGKVTPSDMVSVIVEWAYKGYLRIYDNEKPALVKLEKLKPIPETENEADKALFNSIFFEKGSITIEELQEFIHEKLHQAGNMIIDSFESNPENRIFEVKSFSTKLVLGIIGLSPFLILTVHQLNLNGAMNDSTSGLIFFLVIYAAVLLLLWIKLIERWFTLKSDPKLTVIGFGVLTLIFYSIGVFTVTAQMLSGVTLFLIKSLLVIVASSLTVAFSLVMDRRSQRGTDLYGQIIGLKNFIEAAEKDRIITLVEEDPSYFYKLLPYAYLLGITDAWISKFRSLAIPQPNWFISTSPFNPNDLTLKMIENLRLIKFDMPSYKASKEVGGALLRIGGAVISAGSAGGGGGHSGGGFGGGGGGRW